MIETAELPSFVEEREGGRDLQSFELKNMERERGNLEREGEEEMGRKNSDKTETRKNGSWVGLAGVILFFS